MPNQLELYKNKYRIPSARLSSWDYGSNGYYFVTICTKNNSCFLGDIAFDKASSKFQMNHTKIGEVAQESWMKILEFHPYVKLDAFVIMPNHVHGIIVIDKGEDEVQISEGEVESAKNPLSFQGDAARETQSVASVQLKGENQNRFGAQSKNLASIIRGYKSGVKMYATMNSIPFAWHPRFHDHIIRNEKEYQHIKSYIEQNIQNWGEDKFHRNH